MEFIENKTQVNSLSDNICIGEAELINSSIEFVGKGNILVLDGNVKLISSRIIFRSDNALVYLSSSSKAPLCINVDAWRQTTTFIGKNNCFNGKMTFVTSERQNIIMGNDGMYSFDIWLRTADPHIIFDCESKERINMSKSIVIGDYTWFGQEALLLKGTTIGSGSVVSARGVVSGKRIESNSIYGGNPARLIKRNIFFSHYSVHNYTVEQTKKSMKQDSDAFIFSEPSPDKKIDPAALCRSLTNAETAEEKLAIIKKNLIENQDKNRFYIAPAPQKRLGILKKIFKK